MVPSDTETTRNPPPLGSTRPPPKAMAITQADLRQLACERLADARALLAAGRHDGASYVAGYVVELALKARICRTLKWKEFPFTRKEFEGLQSLRTHDLELLLRLSGRDAHVRAHLLTHWSVVQEWDPEMRYDAAIRCSRAEATEMVEAAATLRARL